MFSKAGWGILEADLHKPSGLTSTDTGYLQIQKFTPRGSNKWISAHPSSGCLQNDPFSRRMQWKPALSSPSPELFLSLQRTYSKDIQGNMPVKQIGLPPTKLTFLKEIEMFAKSFTENLISPIVSNEGKKWLCLNGMNVCCEIYGKTRYLGWRWSIWSFTVSV